MGGGVKTILRTSYKDGSHIPFLQGEGKELPPAHADLPRAEAADQGRGRRRPFGGGGRRGRGGLQGLGRRRQQRALAGRAGEIAALGMKHVDTKFTSTAKP